MAEDIKERGKMLRLMVAMALLGIFLGFCNLREGRKEEKNPAGNFYLAFYKQFWGVGGIILGLIFLGMLTFGGQTWVIEIK